MRIGTDTAFLEIELTSEYEDLVTFRVRMEVSDSRAQFRSVHDSVLFDTTPERRAELEKFRTFELTSIELPFTEGGWLRLQRATLGHITCRIRIARHTHCIMVAASESEILIGGEFGDAFCRDLTRLIFADNRQSG